MIKIGKLQLRNFKSFRKASIPLADGFTTIAGPNGTGKSNILDALMFAFGATSLKMLRASKLTDLVNNSAEDNTAKVEIELKGKQSSFELSRSIDRQGKSVYRLNGKKSSLNEIASLLNELKIKPDGYNIVVQGDINRIIQMNPKERRTIIDETAGIKEFDEKREEALKELGKVENRIKEVRIVLNERQQHLRELENERHSALKFKELSEELKKSKATMLKLEILASENEVQGIESKEKKIAGELEARIREKEELVKELKTMNENLEKINNELIKATEETFEGIGREVETLKADCRVLEEKTQARKEILGKEKSEKQKFREKLQLLSISVQEKEEKNKDLIQELKVLQEQLKELSNQNIQSKLREKLKEGALLSASIESIETALKALKTASAKCPTCDSALKKEKREKLVLEKQEKIEREKNKAEENNKIVKALEAKARQTQELNERNQKLKEENAIVESGLKALKNETAEKTGWLSQIAESIEKAEAKLKELEIELNAKKQELKEKEIEGRKKSEKNKCLIAEKEKTKQALEKLFEKREKIEENVKKTERELNEKSIEKSKFEVRIADLEEELQEFKEVEMLENASLKTLRDKIPRIERELLELGAVNLKAVEGFEEFQKEVEEVRRKVDKLEEERLAVLDLVESIEVKRKETFINCFNKVNENFNKIYYSFFEGSGLLELTSAVEPLEAGLLIQAKHKGENLKTIDLMSGGEKSLTALAFLFAIQLYNPSPFYIFDEADAALDKENTIKLARMIKEVSKKSQFIAITHNDSLIKEADQVIGVALNKQKSSVIGLKLKEALNGKKTAID